MSETLPPENPASQAVETTGNAAPAVSEPQSATISIPPPAEPIATDDIEGIPSTWSTVTLAFSPTGRIARVVDKHIPDAGEEDAFDPEVRIKEWQASWEADLRRQFDAMNGLIVSNEDGLFLYNVLLLRGREIIFRKAFHGALTGIFTEAGAFNCRERLADLLRNDVTFPMMESLRAAVQKAVPGVQLRTPRITEATAELMGEQS